MKALFNTAGKFTSRQETYGLNLPVLRRFRRCQPARRSG
jgi:hypothetical protein